MKTDKTCGKKRTDEGLAFWKKKNKNLNPAVRNFIKYASDALKQGIEPDQLDVRLQQKGWSLENMRFLKSDELLVLDLVRAENRPSGGMSLEDFIERATKAGVKKMSEGVSDVVVYADFGDGGEPVARSLMDVVFDGGELILDFGSIPTRDEQKRDASRRKAASFLG